MQTQPTLNRARLVIQFGLVGLLAIGGLNYNRILDEYALASYHPTQEVQGFESRVSLTNAARAALYRSTPQFDQKNIFNKDCDTRPHELELGCFYRGKIYILQIANASLAPEMDVVGAHELMHAVWTRMSPSDRSKLTPELEKVYAQVANDDLRQRMAGYALSEPGEEANELHSILGTEFAALSPALEEHYAKYFVKRSEIVTAHAAYQAVFDSRKIELERELAQIRAMKAQLSTMNRQLESYRGSGLISAYNALVPKQNALVDDINSRISSYRVGVDEYNGLSKSLDSQEITDTEAAAQ